jgi:metal-responsive CopG/Arc/MetJ family transcriptional regulator
MQITSIALPENLVERIDRAASAADRSRSWVIRNLLERAVTGEQRLKALEEIAAAGLREYAAEHAREPGPNSGEIIAESSVEGIRRLAAFDEIAAGNRKAAK